MTPKKTGLGIVRGEGARLLGEDDRVYWDLFSGNGVALLGQAHPGWVAAITEQARTLSFASPGLRVARRDHALEALCQFAHMDRAWFVDSGTQADAIAIDLARHVTGRPTVIAAAGGAYDRSLGGSDDQARSSLGRRDPDALTVPFGDTHALKHAIDRSVAAVIIEPIQSFGSVEVPPPGYLEDCRRICDAYGALFIIDEVQTGVARCAAPLAWHCEPDALPDMVTLGRALGGGFPVGALLLTEGLARAGHRQRGGSAFSGGPMAAAAVLAVLHAIRDEDLVGRARAIEDRLRARLAGIRDVLAVRGQGCLLGVEVRKDARAVSQELLRAGFLVGLTDDPNCLRLTPPLVLPAQGVDAFIETLAVCLKRVRRSA